MSADVAEKSKPEMLPPLPVGFAHPLPEYLRWSEVLRLFAFWNVGGTRYLLKLVEVGEIVPVERKHCERGKLYPSAQVVGVYPR